MNFVIIVNCGPDGVRNDCGRGVGVPSETQSQQIKVNGSGNCPTKRRAATSLAAIFRYCGSVQKPLNSNSPQPKSGKGSCGSIYCVGESSMAPIHTK